MKRKHPHAIAIGKRLFQARQALRLNVQHLAEIAEVDYRSLRRIENGSCMARASTITKLAPVLGVDREWLEMGRGKGP